MADTCIVCLGDLATTDPPPLAVASEDADPLAPKRASASPGADDSTIAHLLPCKHNLHNTCLKPWVERANSCPICRTDFNVVELKATLDGPCFESYVVQDKKQTAEFDISEFVAAGEDFAADFDIDDDIPRTDCMVCQNDGDPEDLLLCDGCNLTCHTYCCGLHSVPEGSWFCEYCHEDGTANLHYDGARRRANTARFRQQLSGRTQRRAPRGRLGQSDYTRVWQSVLSRTNIDLDFPFEDDAGPSVEAIAHRQEMREWTRRFQIAERQGGAARFRETAGTVMQARNTQQASDPAAQSSEEVRAWGAFDRAREAQGNPPNAEPTRGRKRKSATASPVEPDPPADAERRLKRPRTRRVQDVASSSRGVDIPTASTSQPPATPQAHTEPPPQGSSFLRQLLTEVEHNSSSTERGRSLFDRVTGHTPRTDASPGPASPTYSPSTSNHPSPRMRSASPHSPHSSRPSSPSPGLTSHIEPIYKPHNNSAFSPASPGSHAMGRLSVSSSSDDRFPRPNHRRSSQQLSGSEDEHEGMRRATQPKRSGEASPTRYIHLTFEDKSTLQKMVAGALKPFYHNNEIDTDQFTEINMNVSRKMYEKVEQAGGLKENSDASNWEAVAVAEVEAAVKKLRRSSSSAVADAAPAAPAVVA